MLPPHHFHPSACTARSVLSNRLWRSEYSERFIHHFDANDIYLIQVAEDIGFSKEAGRVQVAQLVDLAMSHYNPKLSPSEAIRIQMPLSQGGGVRSYICRRAAKDRGAQ